MQIAENRSSSSTPSASQLRAARHLLDLKQAEVAALAGISLPTIRRIERQQKAYAAGVRARAAVVKALKVAGIEFIDESDGGGPGVRLRRPARSPD